jgi:hypothetical protein
MRRPSVDESHERGRSAGTYVAAVVETNGQAHFAQLALIY